MVLAEEIARDRAASRSIRVRTDEHGPAVRGGYFALRQHAPDETGLFVVAALNGLPDLLLPGVVRGDREGHELFEADRVFRIEIQQLLRHARELQALLHNLDRDEERGRDLLVRHPALLAQRPERAKLVQRMQRRALNVL